jgi:hypothetical protein
MWHYHRINISCISCLHSSGVCSRDRQDITHVKLVEPLVKRKKKQFSRITYWIIYWCINSPKIEREWYLELPKFFFFFSYKHSHYINFKEMTLLLKWYYFFLDLLASNFKNSIWKKTFKYIKSIRNKFIQEYILYHPTKNIILTACHY